MWRMPARVPDHETIRGTDHRSTSERMRGIDPSRHLDRVRYKLCRRCARCPLSTLLTADPLEQIGYASKVLFRCDFRQPGTHLARLSGENVRITQAAWRPS